MVCDLCGKDTELFTTNVEGSVLNVCNPCSSYGKVIAKVQAPVKKAFQQEQPLAIPTLLPNLNQKIRKAREARNLTQKELAAQLQEKESLLQKVENGFEPSIALATKLEKALHITLIDEGTTEEYQQKPTSNQGALTIGDLIKTKKNSQRV
jgi:putative transcription factor|tara:strand:+ start:295 stop:747 length:453 start_codon:yes stop_codon:yes gene_type:complete